MAGEAGEATQADEERRERQSLALGERQGGRPLGPGGAREGRTIVLDMLGRA
jgi:hypothetical protein